MNNKQYFEQQQGKITNEWLSADSSMIYLNHNLMKNYLNADGAGDTKMKNDILTSEIAKAIVNNPARIVALLNENSKNKIEGVPSTKKLIKLTSDALYNSKVFTDALAKELINPETLNADGQKVTAGEVGTIVGGVSGLVSGLGDLFGGKKKAAAQTEKAKAEAEKAKAEAEKALADKAAALSGGPKIGTWGWVGIVVGAGAIIGIVVYMIRR